MLPDYPVNTSGCLPLCFFDPSEHYAFIRLNTCLAECLAFYFVFVTKFGVGRMRPPESWLRQSRTERHSFASYNRGSCCPKKYLVHTFPNDFKKVNSTSYGFNKTDPCRGRCLLSHPLHGKVRVSSGTAPLEPRGI